MKMINKDRWKLVLLGTVAKKVNRKINPLELGINRRIGGENFISSDLKIRTWGVVGETYLGPAFYMHVIPGDILYVSRNAHLRKVALAEFEAVCANTTYIIRAEESMLLQDLLKHIMLSDSFTQFAISSSKGSTNPFINWKDVEKYKFHLPPLEEQKQLADLFQNIESSLEQVNEQEKNLKALQKSLMNGLLSKEPLFGNLLNSKNCTLTTLGDIAECDKKYPEHEKEVTRFVGLEFIETDNFLLQGWGEIANGTTFSKRFAKGDVLFGKRRAYLKKVAVADFEGICSGDILVIRAKAKKMLQGLLPYYISADAFIQHAVSTSAGSLSPRTKWKDLADLEFSIPDLKTQEKILEVLQQLDNTVNQINQQKTTLKNLKRKLLNEILA